MGKICSTKKTIQTIRRFRSVKIGRNAKKSAKAFNAILLLQTPNLAAGVGCIAWRQI